jgi:hypothetical protein
VYHVSTSLPPDAKPYIVHGRRCWQSDDGRFFRREGGGYEEFHPYFWAGTSGARLRY